MDKRLAALGLLGVGFFVAGSIILGVAVSYTHLTLPTSDLV